jgi:hypothetical protein
LDPDALGDGPRDQDVRVPDHQGAVPAEAFGHGGRRGEPLPRGFHVIQTIFRETNVHLQFPQLNTPWGIIFHPVSNNPPPFPFFEGVLKQGNKILKNTVITKNY